MRSSRAYRRASASSRLGWAGGEGPGGEAAEGGGGRGAGGEETEAVAMLGFGLARVNEYRERQIELMQVRIETGQRVKEAEEAERIALEATTAEVQGLVDAFAGLDELTASFEALDV